jgi:hypothetical protein
MYLGYNSVTVHPFLQTFLRRVHVGLPVDALLIESVT